MYLALKKNSDSKPQQVLSMALKKPLIGICPKMVKAAVNKCNARDKNRGHFFMVIPLALLAVFLMGLKILQAPVL